MSRIELIDKHRKIYQNFTKLMMQKHKLDYFLYNQDSIAISREPIRIHKSLKHGTVVVEKTIDKDFYEKYPDGFDFDKLEKFLLETIDKILDE